MYVVSEANRKFQKLQISKFSWGSIPPDPLVWVTSVYYKFSSPINPVWNTTIVLAPPQFNNHCLLPLDKNPRWNPANCQIYLPANVVCNHRESETAWNSVYSTRKFYITVIRSNYHVIIIGLFQLVGVHPHGGAVISFEGEINGFLIGSWGIFNEILRGKNCFSVKSRGYAKD